MNFVIVLTDYLPLQQGLRQLSETVFFTTFPSLTDYLPLQQGLRLLVTSFFTKETSSTHRLSSTTTRIKTTIIEINLELNASAHRLSSTTTRIKTFRHQERNNSGIFLTDYLPLQQGLRLQLRGHTLVDWSRISQTIFHYNKD